jgi:hypothetical protein
MVCGNSGICDLPQSYKPPFQVNITCHDHHMHSKKSSPPGEVVGTEFAGPTGIT